MTQLSMFGGPLPTTEMKRQEKHAAKIAARPSIDQRFAEFWLANPHVWDELKKIALARLASGSKRVGVKALWEELRTKLAKRELAYDGFGIPRETAAAFKLDNSFTALYARKLIERHPELAAVIEVRKRKGEK